MSQAPTPLVVDEHAVAAAYSLSLWWLRKDRTGKRILPFYKIGQQVRYDLNKVAEALAKNEHGGAR